MNQCKSLIFIAGILALLTLNAYAQTTTNRTKTMTQTKVNESQSFEEYKAVTEALQPYIKSAKSGDGKLNRTAFYDHAHIVGSVDGEYSNPNADDFSKGITEFGPAPDVRHHIAWIDISGPAAAAKVEFIHWNGFRFTDFFVLYKHDGQWKISGKVYDSHSNN